MIKDILFLTTSNLPTNPRLLKEIDLLSTDHSVTVILFKLGNWSDSINEELIESRIHIKFVLLDATRKNYLYWFFWALMEKVTIQIGKIYKKSIILAAAASSRRSIMLYCNGLKVTKPNLIIGHNLGALFPCWKLSKNWNIPFVFDVEDFHPGETISVDSKNELERREFLFKKILPDARYITFASSLIREYTLSLIGGLLNNQVILNSFPKNEFIQPKLQNDENLRIVWFSQTVSFGRGLEQFFEALQIIFTKEDFHSKLLKNKVNKLVVTIIGDMDPTFSTKVIDPFFISVSACSTIIQLNIIPPLPQNELHKELANHDIGLALEFDSTDLNRNICLTNKILAYSQAGLYILATDTDAQVEFINNYPLKLSICGQSSQDIADILLTFNLEVIRLGKARRYEIGKSYAWEEEGKKIKNLLYNIN